MGNFLEGHFQQFLLGITDDRTQAGIDLEEVSFKSDQGHSNGGMLECTLELLLAFLQGSFSKLPLADVLQGIQAVGAITQRHQAAAIQNGKRLTVATTHRRFEILYRTTAKQLKVAVSLLRMDPGIEFNRGATKDFFPGESESLDSGSVDFQEPAVRISEQADDDWALVEYAAKALLALPHGLLRLLPLNRGCHLVGDEAEQLLVFLRVAQGTGIGLHGQDANGPPTGLEGNTQPVDAFGAHELFPGIGNHGLGRFRGKQQRLAAA